MKTDKLRFNSSVFIIFIIAFSPLAFIEKGEVLMFLNQNYNWFLNLFFKTLSSIGNGFTALIIAVLLLSFCKAKYVFQFVMSFLIQLVFLLPFKQIFFKGSFRPLKYFEVYHPDILLNTVEGFQIYHLNTFPSGHTACIFFIITFICFYVKSKPLTVLLFCFAFLVGFSRIYLVQHFFIDVYFGAIFGFLSSTIAFLITFRNHKTWYEKMVLPKFSMFYTKEKFKVLRMRYFL